MPRRTFPLIVLSMLAPAAAVADDTHYQDQIVGEDALGMGGAFTAIADDASAAFYNPAGLAQIPGSSISGSLSVYGYERRAIANGLSTDLGTRNLVHEDYPTRAIGGGVVKRLGKRGPDRQRPFAIAFSTFVPFQSSFRYQVGFRVPDPYGDGTILYADDAIEMSEEDRTVWVGPSFAYRFSERLSVGLSAFLSTRMLDRHYDQSRTDVIEETDPPGANPTEYANIITTDLSLTALTGVLRLGVLYTPSRRLRFGLMLSPPSLPLMDDATIRNRSLIATAYDVVSYDRSKFGGLETNAAMPANARLGMAYVFSDTALVALDGSVWLPLSYTTERPLVQEAGFAVDNYFVTEFERKLTTNVNLGFETLLGENWPLRVGAFTNFSSAPDVESGDIAMQPHADMFGGSFAFGYRDEGYDISLGAAAMYGRGHALAYRTTDDPDNVDPYSRERYEQTAVYIYLAGAKKAAGRAVRSFIKPD